jgi:hypothetical protein
LASASPAAGKQSRWGVTVSRWLVIGVGLALAAAAIAVWEARVNGVKGEIARHALPDVLRALAAALGMFFLSGYALARWLAPPEMGPHVFVLAFPLGAASSALGLAALGLVQVPFTAALVIVLAAGALSALIVRVRAGPLPATADDEAGGAIARLAWPAYICALIIAIALVPVFRIGTATVLGQNGDAVLAVGTVDFVKHAPPQARRDSLAVDRLPPAWWSKYPIFCSMGAISALSGIDPIKVFPTLAATMLALIAVGFFFFARYALRAPPWAALLVLALVPLDRVLIYVTDHPYYNELWGLFALPFVLLFGLEYLRRPAPRTLILFGVFIAIGAFAYPLMLPFPSAFLTLAAVVIWRRRRAAGELVGWISALRRGSARRSRWRWILLAVLAFPAVVVLGSAVLVKALSALEVVLPGHTLSGWGGAIPYFKVHRFFGLLDPLPLGVITLAALLACAGWALWRSPRDVGLPLAVVAAFALLFAYSFRVRRDGELFYFKDLSFLAPIIVTLAVTGLADLLARSRSVSLKAAAIGGLSTFAVMFAINVNRELELTHEQGTRDILALRGWAKRLPAPASVRVDIPPTGVQLWAGMMLSRHPLSSTRPFTKFFPSPRLSRKADYVLIERAQPRPADADGQAVLQNTSFRLYRMKRDVPGPDLSSRRMSDGG